MRALQQSLLGLALFVASGSLGAQGQAFVGVWKTVDDATQGAKSHLEVYERNGKYYGKVVRLLKDPEDSRCEKCPGERKNQPVMNMVLLVDMILQDGMLQGGQILDPEKGKWYACKMWLQTGNPQQLVVRGYLGPFYRTQYWHRVQ